MALRILVGAVATALVLTLPLALGAFLAVQLVALLWAAELARPNFTPLHRPRRRGVSWGGR